MTTSPARPLWRGRTLALVGIVLVAFSLRSAVASLSPVIDHIQDDFTLPAWVAGLIGTAPPVCFAVFGILTPRFERMLGLERLTIIALAVVAAGLLARGLSVDSMSLLLTTTMIFAGVGVGNILLPPLVKKHFPDRIGLMTTLFSTTMAASTFLPPLVAVPVADAVGWRVSLGMWAIFAVLAIVPWVALLVRERAAAVDDIDLEVVSPRAFGRMWRLPLAWAITALFAISGIIAYVSFAWLPLELVDTAGVTHAQAGALLSLFAAVGLPTALVVPMLVARYRVVPLLSAIAIVAGLAGIAGLLWAPATVTWLWVALLGIAPLLFPLTLVLLGLRTRTHEASVALSGFVQSIGYAVVALFPVGIGVLHDVTGGWTAALWVLAIVIVASIPAVIVAARPHTVEDEWERHHGAW